jgi:hypothetical protein
LKAADQLAGLLDAIAKKAEAKLAAVKKATEGT